MRYLVSVREYINSLTLPDTSRVTVKPVGCEPLDIVALFNNSKDLVVIRTDSAVSLGSAKKRYTHNYSDGATRIYNGDGYQVAAIQGIHTDFARTIVRELNL